MKKSKNNNLKVKIDKKKLEIEERAAKTISQNQKIMQLLTLIEEKLKNKHTFVLDQIAEIRKEILKSYNIQIKCSKEHRIPKTIADEIVWGEHSSTEITLNSKKIKPEDEIVRVKK